MPLRCGGFNCESLWSVQVCQLREGFVKDEDEREAMWEQQHELASQKMYSLCFKPDRFVCFSLSYFSPPL